MFSVLLKQHSCTKAPRRTKTRCASTKACWACTKSHCVATKTLSCTKAAEPHEGRYRHESAFAHRSLINVYCLLIRSYFLSQSTGFASAATRVDI